MFLIENIFCDTRKSKERSACARDFYRVVDMYLLIHEVQVCRMMKFRDVRFAPLICKVLFYKLFLRYKGANSTYAR